jgi:hypothetical protein
MKWLTKSDYLTGRTFTGYLADTDLGPESLVVAGSGLKWLYVKTNPTTAITWKRNGRRKRDSGKGKSSDRSHDRVG